MTKAEFARGMAVLDGAFPSPAVGADAARARAAAYYVALGQLDAEAWLRIVHQAVRTWKPAVYGAFPAPVELLELGEPDATLKAEQAYTAILAHYAGDGGRVPQSHAERVAFAAAGGSAAFAWCEPEYRALRQRRFLEAYMEAAKDERAERLLGTGEVGRAEAAQLVERIGEVER